MERSFFDNIFADGEIDSAIFFIGDTALELLGLYSQIAKEYPFITLCFDFDQQFGLLKNQHHEAKENISKRLKGIIDKRRLPNNSV